MTLHTLHGNCILALLAQHRALSRRDKVKRPGFCYLRCQECVVAWQICILPFSFFLKLTSLEALKDHS